MSNIPVTENPQFSETMEQISVKDRGAPDTFNPRYQVLLDNDNYLKQEGERARRTVVVTLLASGWSASVPYSQRVAVAGLMAADEPAIHSYTPKELDAASVKARRKMTSMLSDGETEDGFLTVYCGEKKPSIDFPILLKGVSTNG